jgi:MFS superfamily sulfate permease-like transporter
MILFDFILGVAFGIMATLATVLVVLSREGYVPREPSLDPDDGKTEDENITMALTENEQNVIVDAYDGFLSVHNAYPTCAQLRDLLSSLEFENES